MRKIVVLSLLACLIALPLPAQKKKTGRTAPLDKSGYRIEVSVEDAHPGDSLFLRAYEGDQNVAADTAVVSAGGKAIFTKATPLPVGMYAIGLATAQQGLDFFLSEGAPQHFLLSYNSAEGLSSARFTGSPENEALADYIRFIMQKSQRRQALQDRMQRHMQKIDSAVSISRQMQQLFTEVKEKWSEIEKDYQGKLFALFIKAMREPEPTPFQEPAGLHANPDSLEKAHYYNFFKEHFFDNYDFSSPYIIKMPHYGNAINTYFMQMLRPEEGELKYGADALLSKAGANDEVYKYTVQHLYRMFREAPDAFINDLSVYVGEKYIVERPQLWDSAFVEKTAKAVIAAKLNPVGSVAADLKLQDLAGNYVSLLDVQAPYTVLYFFNPLCHSCAVVTPLVHDLYVKYKDKGLQCYAVYVDHRRSDWAPYIAEKGYLDWINVWDPDENGSGGVYQKYDVHAIPIIYLLDKDKKVVAKDLFYNTLEMWLQNLMP